MTTTASKSNRNGKIPSSVYAVAGAGEYAYRQLRKLPAVAAELREELPNRVAELRTEIPARVERARSELTGRRVPDAMNTLLAEGLRVYTTLVARGEKVVNRGRRQAATTVAPVGDVVKKPTGRAAAPRSVKVAPKAAPAPRKATRTAKATAGTRARRTA
jgi:hypothetical protein